MESNFKAIENSANNGYNLDLGIVLEKSFQVYKKIAGIAGIAMLIVGVAILILFVGLFSVIYGVSNFSETMLGFQSGLIGTSEQVTLLLISSFFAAIFAIQEFSFI